MNVKMYRGLDKEFTDACTRASAALGKEILPTRRQHKKWLRKCGSAWTHGRNTEAKVA